MKIIEHNVESDQQTVRDATPAEKKTIEQQIAQTEKTIADNHATRQALLEKLGLTEQEIAILLS